jgi:hypothetical protein
MFQFICHKIIKPFNRKTFLIFLTLLFSREVVMAQTTEDSVKATINSLFTAMKNADSVALKESFAENMILQTISLDKQGNAVINTEMPEKFARSIGQLKAGDADEQISFEVVKIDGPLAMAWTPYRFYYKGNFSHCGVNSFQLVRVNGLWKIQYIIDTRRKVGCK